MSHKKYNIPFICGLMGCKAAFDHFYNDLSSGCFAYHISNHIRLPNPSIELLSSAIVLISSKASFLYYLAQLISSSMRCAVHLRSSLLSLLSNLKNSDFKPGILCSIILAVLLILSEALLYLPTLALSPQSFDVIAINISTFFKYCSIKFIRRQLPVFIIFSARNSC